VLGEVLTATVTPFDADGAVNLPKFRELAAFLVDNGSDGLVVTGTTGESPTLTDDERFQLYTAALETIGDRATVIAGTGTYDTRHSVHLTERAHELGVHGFLVVTPYYNKPPPRGIVEHVKAIATVTDRPIVYYNIPARVVNLVSVETLERGDDERAELRAGVGPDLRHRLDEPAGAAVRAIGGQRVERVRDEDDSRGERNRLAGEAVGVAAAVHSLVARPRDLEDDRREPDAAEDVLRDDGVAPHHLPFLVGQRAGLVEDRLGDADLADVVEQRADLDRVEIRADVAETARELHRDRGNPLGVLAGGAVLRLDAPRERGDRREVLLPDSRDQLGALECGRKLGEDRVAETRPALAIELRGVVEDEGADVVSSRDQRNARLGEPDVHLGGGAREAADLLLGEADQLPAVVAPRGQAAREREEVP